MEEDIKHLEKRIDLNRQMYLEFGRLLSLDEETVNAIENLINKNKELEKERDGIYADYQDLGKEKLELEKMVELMADSIKHYKTVGDGTLNTRPATREEKIGWFRKKAKGG